MYDLEDVLFHSSQSLFYRNKPATVAFSADVYNVRGDEMNIPAANPRETNFALKVSMMNVIVVLCTPMQMSRRKRIF